MEVAQSTKLRCHRMEKWYLLASWTSPIFVDKHQCPNCCCSKRRLTKFNSVTKHTFYLHLKDTEFGFNHLCDNLYPKVIKLLRNIPI